MECRARRSQGAQLALGLGLVLLGTAALPLHAQDGADSASQQQTALRRVRLDIRHNR